MADTELKASRDAADAAEELWRWETHELVIRMFRARVLLVPLLLFVLVAFAVFDPIPWKLALLAGTVVLVTGMFVLEQRRLRRTRADQLTVHVNLLFAVVMQSLLIFVTGGIASPLLVVYVPLAALAGLSLSQRWRALTVLAVPVSVVVALSVGAWTGWLPTMIPAFFQLDNPVSQGHAWLFTRTGVLLIVLLISLFAGLGVRSAFERVVRGAIELRRGALDTLESRNREILSTSVTIAHELKNPLSSIQGLAQLMARRAEAGSKDRERLDVMLREIGRMTTVLDEFRNFSRPLSGLTCTTVSLTDLVSSIVTLHEGTAARRGITLLADEGMAVEAECDGQKVKQALVNLVQNAMEASPRGKQVHVGARQTDQQVTLYVADAGPGVDAQLLDKLFTPGFTTKERGTGIGLVVARSVVEQHGGTLTLESGAAGGCTATITLPRKARSSPEVQP